MKQEKTLFIADPHGVCAGVGRAIETVEQLLQTAGETVWVLHELVHNDFLTAELSRRGVRFTENLNEVPDGSVLLLGAHGVSNEVEKIARQKRLQVTDATCPLVRKLQNAACDAVKNGEKVILFGHGHHPEVCGVLGRLPQEMVYLASSADEVKNLPELNGFPCRMFAQTTMNICIKNPKDGKKLSFDTSLAYHEDQKFCYDAVEDKLTLGYCADAEYLYLRNPASVTQNKCYAYYIFEDTMAMCGAKTLADITPDMIWKVK